MTLQEAVKKVFSNYANFNGRARRSEYWYWQLFTVLVSLFLGAVSGTFQAISDSSFLASALPGIWSIAIIIPNLAVAVRRLHDIGKSGVSILIGLIPLVGEIILIIWLVQDSQAGINQYGENPKGVGNQPYNPYGAQSVQPQYNNGQNPYYVPQQPAQQPYNNVQNGYYVPQQPAVPTQEQPQVDPNQPQ